MPTPTGCLHYVDALQGCYSSRLFLSSPVHAELICSAAGGACIVELHFGCDADL